MILFIWSLAILLTAFSFLKSNEKTIRALRVSINSLKNLTPAILGMVVLVGLIITIFPKEKLVLIFNHEGFYGILLVSIIGAIVTIPGPISFPLAGALLKMGANQELLASFITTLTMVGFATSPLEISYFGKRFTILRQGLSFVAAIMIGLIMKGVL